MLSTFRADIARLPIVTRLGLWVFGTGAALDLIVHTAPEALSETMHNYLGHDGATAHLVTIAGMLAIVAGVMDQAIRKQSPKPAVEQERKEEPIARGQ
jgi:hypothetical protein